jgi:peptidylprolyl isomerase
MRKLAVALCLLATPALATGLEIDVEGDAQGTIVIDLLEEVAPQHVERITTLAASGAYDDVVFHRVIDGFMAQTGDVEFGVMGMDMRYAGRGGSEFRTCRRSSPTSPMSAGSSAWRGRRSPNSANSQFFIMFAPAPPLDGQYTVVGTGRRRHGDRRRDQARHGPQRRRRGTARPHDRAPRAGGGPGPPEEEAADTDG